jgi:uncharacterized membrane protein
MKVKFILLVPKLFLVGLLMLSSLLELMFGLSCTLRGPVVLVIVVEVSFSFGIVLDILQSPLTLHLMELHCPLGSNYQLNHSFSSQYICFGILVE